MFRGFCLRCGIHTALGVLPGRCVVSDLLGGVHTYLLRAFFVRLYLCTNSCGIIEIYIIMYSQPVHLVVQVKIFYAHAHVFQFYV